MRSQLLTDTAELTNVFREWCAKAEDIRIVSAWATTDCIGCSELTAVRSRISTLVIGLDFYSTSPSFLDAFRANVRIGKANGNATFHPKVYLFTQGKLFCCLLGSSNFTRGGFGGNIEVNVCMTGAQSEPFFAQISAYIDGQEQQADEISSPEIADYREQFAKMADEKARLSKFRASEGAKAQAKARKTKETQGEEPPEQLNKTWAEYVRLILAQEKRRGLIIQRTPENIGYLETAEYCQQLFEQHNNLRRMAFSDRQFVGGTVGVAGWFGTMHGNGLFKQRLNNNPQSLDAALDHISLREQVSRRQFNAFVANYQWKRSGVGTASRLLAMKRPDLFMCINSSNRLGIARALDVTRASLQTFDGYWDLMVRIWKCPWWRNPKPSRSLELRIWKARVALLDAVYYYFE